MPLNIPESALTIFERIAVDISTEINELDPFLRNSLIRAIVVSDANAFFELYKTLDQLTKESFWDTATGEFLTRWAAIFGITKNPATKATGFVTFTGIDSSVIPLGTGFTSDNAETYQTLVAALITTQALSVSTLTRVSQIATVTTTLDHGLASNIDITISGAVETEYNGTFTIVVTGLNTFTYDVTGTPSTPATGTILATAIFANVESKSDDFGVDTNIESGTKVSLSSPVTGVDTDGFVSFDELSGGTDEESDEDLRDRFLFRVQNPIALFNNNAIIDAAKQVSGVTRVFVQNVDSLTDSVTASSITRAGFCATVTTGSAHGLSDGQVITVTGAVEPEYNVVNEKILVIDTTSFIYIVNGSPSTPATGTISINFSISTTGQVRVFFMRDNDATPIPSPSEVTTVKNKILEIKPAQMSASDLIVLAPTGVTTAFPFSSITPDTQDMKDP